MGMTAKVRTRRLEAGSYEVRRGAEVIASVVRTGEYGRDDYPWDWSLADAVQSVHPHGRRTGVADTKAGAVDSALAAAGVSA